MLVDAPPSAGLLAMNVLMAVDEVLVPVTGDYYGLHGVSRFMQILRHIDEALERETAGVDRADALPRAPAAGANVRDKLIEYFPESVLATPVRECAQLARARVSARRFSNTGPRARALRIMPRSPTTSCNGGPCNGEEDEEQHRIRPAGVDEKDSRPSSESGRPSSVVGRPSTAKTDDSRDGGR